MNIEDLLVKLSIAKSAAEIANKIHIEKPSDFALKNSSTYSPTLLKAILTHQKFKDAILIKIPDWNGNSDLISPEKISLEQASSKITAELKCQYLSGKTILDLTGGMGVDSYYFSKIFSKIIHNEPSAFLSAVVKHNFKALGLNNVSFTQHLAEEYPQNTVFDWVFIDPDRRNDINRKSVLLADCKPDIGLFHSHWFKLAPSVMIKLSPMLDIKTCLKTLDNIAKVLIISEKNEVKELILILLKNQTEEPTIICLNKIESQTESFEFRYSDEEKLLSEFKDPQPYIYLPNASILKAGAFKSIEKPYGLNKIAVNSHLYSSNAILEDFPGRVFELIALEKDDKKALEKHIPNKQANIACRNYPKKPEQIKKELGWKDGGDFYVFFTENQKKKKIVLICRKIQKKI